MRIKKINKIVFSLEATSLTCALSRITLPKTVGDASHFVVLFGSLHADEIRIVHSERINDRQSRKPNRPDNPRVTVTHARQSRRGIGSVRLARVRNISSGPRMDDALDRTPSVSWGEFFSSHEETVINVS